MLGLRLGKGYFAPFSLSYSDKHLCLALLSWGLVRCSLILLLIQMFNTLACPTKQYYVTAVCNDFAKIELLKPRNEGCACVSLSEASLKITMADGYLSESQCGVQPRQPVSFNVAGTRVGIQVIPANSTGPWMVVPNQRWCPGSSPSACCGLPSGVSGPTRSYKCYHYTFSSTWPAKVHRFFKVMVSRSSHTPWWDRNVLCCSIE